MPMNEPVIDIITGNSSRSVSGADTTIFTMPPQLYVTIGDGPPALAVQQFGKYLRSLVEYQAANLGEELHHAEFVVTTDPAVVEARGIIHDCEECRASVREALRILRDEPELELVVGTLYWAGP